MLTPSDHGSGTGHVSRASQTAMPVQTDHDTHSITLLQSFGREAGNVAIHLARLRELQSRSQVAGSRLHASLNTAIKSQHQSTGSGMSESTFVAAGLPISQCVDSGISLSHWSRGDAIGMCFDLESVEREQNAFMRSAGKLYELFSLVQSEIGPNGRALQQPSAAEKSPASPDLPPLLAQYYDKAGDIKLLGERLVELDLDYQADMVSRDLRGDQSCSPDAIDNAVEEHYVAARRKLEGALDVTIEIADTLKAKCLDAGLVIETATNYSPSIQDADEPSNASAAHEDDEWLRRSLQQRIKSPSHCPSITANESSDVIATHEDDEWSNRSLQQRIEALSLCPGITADEPSNASAAHEDDERLRRSLQQRMTTPLHPGIQVEHIGADRLLNKTPPPRVDVAKVSEWAQNVPTKSEVPSLHIPQHEEDRRRSSSSGHLPASSTPLGYSRSTRAHSSPSRVSLPMDSIDQHAMDNCGDRVDSFNSYRSYAC